LTSLALVVALAAAVAAVAAVVAAVAIPPGTILPIPSTLRMIHL
jgi:hypothetical protein